MLAVMRRDLLLAMRRKTEVLTALFFFVIVTSLFPLGIGPEPALLRKIAPGVLWVGALLATMLGLQRMFAADHADGTLEQMVLSPTPLLLLVARQERWRTGWCRGCRWWCWRRCWACSSTWTPRRWAC